MGPLTLVLPKELLATSGFKAADVAIAENAARERRSANNAAMCMFMALPLVARHPARASIGSKTPLWRFAETEKLSNRYCGRESSLADVSGQATSTPRQPGAPARFSVPRKLLVATQAFAECLMGARSRSAKQLEDPSATTPTQERRHRHPKGHGWPRWNQSKLVSRVAHADPRTELTLGPDKSPLQQVG